MSFVSDLDIAVKEFGMAYRPFPASRDWSTLGGNVATNAGGWNFQSW